ncbi:MAG TPA: YihY/virulence factor BrkB family protein [Gemmatimonadaceae bacterium]|jgi:membrane protein|nr:YihY/virulence factor BrkB family protein [Gemmatimonadaceae bacterium]
MSGKANSASPAGHRGIVGILIGAGKDFSKDKCTLRAAALSYATIFALPPLLIVLIKLAGALWSPEQIQHSIEGEFAALIGGDGAQAVHDMVTNASRTGHGWIATTYGIIGLALGATGEFLALQGALNAVWGVAPDPKQGGVRRFLLKRLVSIAMTMGVAFLLVVSLAITALLAALVHALGDVGWIIQVLNSLVALAALSVLFAAMFKFLPDAEIRWRSVWVGGIATAVLFEAGKFAIGLYLGQTNPGNAFGAARTFAVILVWIYYAGILLLFGAEFTEHFAAARGHPVHPKSGAMWVADSRDR